MAHQRLHKLDAYLGPLSPEQAAAGIQAALRNARSLVEDATILLDRERWPRAASLSILAIEEAGKVPLLRSLLLVDTEKELKHEWRAYRSHTKKNVMGLFLQYLRESPLIEDFRPLFDPNGEHPQLLDAVKQLGFYSDCLGDAHWSIPDDVIDEALARQLHVAAKCLAGTGESAMTSAPELRLWVKHLKPVWRKDMLPMKQALIDCYQEATDLGILRGNRSVDDMVKFLL